MRKRLILLLTAGLCTLTGCATIGQINLLTTEQEVEIGRQAAGEIEGQLKPYPDPEVQAYVDSLGQALARHSRRTDITYHFKVVDTDDVNAFALPGGWLYVNRGLIAAAADESELAGVIGHEIGHVVGRHGARQVTKQFGLAILIELATGGENPSLARRVGAQFASMGAGLTLLKYSRDAEREADALAVEETYAAGVDPNGMATFFEKLLALHESEPEGTAVWFSTHPPSTERIHNVRNQIRQLPPKPGLKSDSARFREIRARLLQRHPPGRKQSNIRQRARVRR
jgi:predicted Zn-dependent protease